MIADPSRLARVLWLVAVVATTGLWVGAPASQWGILNSACHPDTACRPFQLGREAVRTLNVHGISLGGYAAFTAIGLAVLWLVWYGLATLIIWRRPTDRGALLAAFFLVLLPTWGTSQWLPPGPSSVLNSIFLSMLLVFLLLFPDGGFRPGWTGWLAAAVVVVCGSTFLPVPAPWSGIRITTVLGLVIAVLGVQVYRFHALSSTVQRQQTKWAVFGLTVAVAGLIGSWLLTATAPFPTGSGSLFQGFINVTGNGLILTVIPASIATAILRNRLWDIDRVINRALVYLALTGTVAGIYVLSILALQGLSRAVFGHSSPLVIALSTLGIAALVGPMRRYIQTGIDRRFYRSKYDAERMLATFGEHLRDEVDMSHLSNELTSVVQDALHPEHVTFWLRPQ